MKIFSVVVLLSVAFLFGCWFGQRGCATKAHALAVKSAAIRAQLEMERAYPAECDESPLLERPVSGEEIAI